MKNFLLSAVTLFLTLTAWAKPPTTQSLETLLGIMEIEKMLGQLVSNMEMGMEQGIQQLVREKNLSAEDEAELKQIKTELTATLRDELSLAKTKDIYLQVYRDLFTQEEVDGIIAFYKTPAGQAMVEKAPSAMQRAGELMQARLAPISQKMEARMDQFQKRIEKK